MVVIHQGFVLVEPDMLRVHLGGLALAVAQEVNGAVDVTMGDDGVATVKDGGHRLKVDALLELE